VIATFIIGTLIYCVFKYSSLYMVTWRARAV